MLGRIANGLFAAIGAAGAAQFPAFYRQYLQHLAGRLAQAREDLAPIADDAQARGMSVATYLDKAAGEGGELTQTLVAGYRSTFQAVQRLESAHAALSSAGPLERPLELARHFDTTVARGTLEGFGPALPMSAEGAAYAGVGLLLGIAVVWSLERPVLAVARRRRAARRARRRISQIPAADPADQVAGERDQDPDTDLHPASGTGGPEPAGASPAAYSQTGADRQPGPERQKDTSR